ncbi:hypothetical protein GJ744_009612 [Endocarpon pusillum]|uniref:Uncharacterized protein n=1 Tax=Endocarpon pusillum TaxID=364733 RepID=A0A8H7E489_9EURO|nr:hypothetical protein GJ744_009612 [Endocarpon pusillum]
MGCGRSKERSAPPLHSEQDLTGFSFAQSQPSALSQQEINTPTQDQGRAATTPSQPLIHSYVLQLASRPAREQQPTNTRIRQQRLDARDTQIPVGRPSEEQRWGDHPARLRQRANDSDSLRRLSLQSERSSLPGIRTSISSERSSPSPVRGASPVGERIPPSIRGQSGLRSSPEGRESPFSSPLVQESYLSCSSSASSSSSQQRRKASGSSQSPPGGANPARRALTARKAAAA